MRADVLQAAALCCHSNAFLSGEAIDAPEMLHNSTFRLVSEVLFERAASNQLANGIFADATGPWLRKLRDEGVGRLGLSLAACPFDPRVAPDEPWGILSDDDLGAEIWTPLWRRRIRGDTDASPWHVTYVASRGSVPSTTAAVDLAVAAKLLRGAIQRGAASSGLIGNLKLMKEVLHPDLFPTGWPAEQAELGDLAAKTVTLLRSEEWAQTIFRRQLDPSDHQAISQLLWKAALIALEAAAMPTEQVSARPMTQSFPRAG